MTGSRVRTYEAAPTRAKAIELFDKIVDDARRLDAMTISTVSRRRGITIPNQTWADQSTPSVGQLLPTTW